MSQVLTPSSVRVYLSAVVLMHKLAGFSDPINPSQFSIEVVLKGTKRFQALQSTRKREPITLQLLDKLLSQIQHTGSIIKKDQYTLLFTLTFFGLLRLSEFTVSSMKEFNPRIRATKKQCAFVKESQHLLPLLIQNRPSEAPVGSFY